MDENIGSELIGKIPHYYSCGMCGKVKSFKRDKIIPVFLDAHLYGVCPDCVVELDSGQSEGVIGFSSNHKEERIITDSRQYEIVDARSSIEVPEDYDQFIENRRGKQ